MFEGPFDFLTRMSMRADPANADASLELPCAVIILHSVSLRRRALAAITNHGFGRVVLFLDRDEAGRETLSWFRSALGNRNVVDRSSDYQGYKDLNAWRVAQGKRDHESVAG